MGAALIRGYTKYLKVPQSLVRSHPNNHPRHQHQLAMNPLKEAKLCGKCEDVFKFRRTEIQNSHKRVKDERTQGEDRPVFYQHHRDASELGWYAKTGRCRICSILWESLPNTMQDRACEPFETDGASIRFPYRGQYRISYFLCQSTIHPGAWQLCFQIPEPGYKQELDGKEGKCLYGSVHEYTTQGIELVPFDGDVLIHPGQKALNRYPIR